MNDLLNISCTLFIHRRWIRMRIRSRFTTWLLVNVLLCLTYLFNISYDQSIYSWHLRTCEHTWPLHFEQRLCWSYYKLLIQHLQLAHKRRSSFIRRFVVTCPIRWSIIQVENKNDMCNTQTRIITIKGLWMQWININHKEHWIKE